MPMKRLPFIFLMLGMLGTVVSCNSDDEDTWSKYSDWRETNTAFFISQRDSLDADGNLYFKTLFPVWNPGAEILIHYFNDRELTKDNLSPLLTSTCSVIYYGRLCNGEPFDSSYTATAYGRGIVRFKPQDVVQGFAIALMDMHVGDTCEVVMPYSLAYGGQSKGAVLPYSALRFNIRLTDIPYYDTNN